MLRSVDRSVAGSLRHCNVMPVMAKDGLAPASASCNHCDLNSAPLQQLPLYHHYHHQQGNVHVAADAAIIINNAE